MDLKESVRALRHACRLICSCAQAEWLKQLMTFCCEILKCFLMPHTPIASLVSRDFRYFLVAYIAWLPQVGPATYVHSSSWSIPTNNSPTRYDRVSFQCKDQHQIDIPLWSRSSSLCKELTITDKIE